MFEIGLDLSSNKISAVELFKKRNDIYIKNAGIVDIEPHAISSGELVDSVVLTNGLKELWKNFKFQKKIINIGLSGIKLIIKEIELPLTEDKDIERAINFQIDEYIPFPKENIIFDFYTIEKGSNSSKIMLIGVMKNVINSFVKAVEDAGLKVNSVDLNCFAFYRALNFLYNFKKLLLAESNSSLCLIYFGIDTSIIEFAYNNEVRYPRFINSSINSFIDNLNKKLNLPMDELKRKIFEFDFELLLMKESKKKKDEDNKNINQEQEINNSLKSLNEDNKNNSINNLNSNNDAANEIGSNLSSDYLNDNISNEEGNKINNIQNTEEVKNFGDLDQKNKNVVTEKDNIEDLSLKIKDSLKISANQLVNEIIRSNDHFLQENRDLKINKILIAGENLKNIDKYIEKNLKIPVERISINKIIYNDLLKKNNLFKEGNLDNLANNLIIPTGLALRGIK